MQWNATKWEVPEADIFSGHMRVLEDALSGAEEFPVGGASVQKAIEYFHARANRQGGINLFLYGMKENRIDCMTEGLALLKKHLGV